MSCVVLAFFKRNVDLQKKPPKCCHSDTDFSPLQILAVFVAIGARNILDSHPVCFFHVVTYDAYKVLELFPYCRQSMEHQIHLPVLWHIAQFFFFMCKIIYGTFLSFRIIINYMYVCMYNARNHIIINNCWGLSNYIFYICTS